MGHIREVVTYCHVSRWGGVQLEGQVLLVEPLLAKLEEFNLSSEVLSDQVLGILRNWGLVNISVDLREFLDLV